MKIGLIAFTQKGYQLGQKIVTILQGNQVTLDKAFGEDKVEFKEWTRENFPTLDSLIFIGAMGICVRAIAPFVKSKLTDPSVLVLDEQGKYCISVLSGHIGGGNELAEAISSNLKSQAVITTATDVNGLFAIDTFAKKRQMEIENTQQIKEVSAKLLRGELVRMKSDLPLQNLPSYFIEVEDMDCDIYLGIHSCGQKNILILRPKVLHLGIGCRKGKEAELIQDYFHNWCAQVGISSLCFQDMASIDVKREEVGILELANTLKVPVNFYSAEELNQVKGTITSSAFVRNTVGTDNVCERSACKIGEELVCHKYAIDGVTFAASITREVIDFRERTKK